MAKGFIRIKQIKGKKYAYYVVNKWKKGKGSRQKVRGYLGRVINLEKKESLDFINKFGISDISGYAKAKNKESVVHDLITHELQNLGFSEQEGNLVLGSLLYNKNEKKLVLKENGKEKNIVLELNEGFMCNHTLRNLFGFKAAQDNNPYLLAKAFLEAGINIPKELFVEAYDKFF